MKAETTVTVVGASGLVGSHVVKAALARGYRVNGTLRDHRAPDKAPYLMALDDQFDAGPHSTSQFGLGPTHGADQADAHGLPSREEQPGCDRRHQTDDEHDQQAPSEDFAEEALSQSGRPIRRIGVHIQSPFYFVTVNSNPKSYDFLTKV